jgi:hypothetical protein
VCGVRPRFAKYCPLKTKFFKKDPTRPQRLKLRKRLWTALCPASCGQYFKTKTFGAGVVRARPPHNYALASSKFGAGKFCRFKEQKRKFSRKRKGY